MGILELLIRMEEKGMMEIYRDGENVITLWHPITEGKPFYLFRPAMKKLKPQLLKRLSPMPESLREHVAMLPLE